jgi:hypothetical protein
MGLSAGFSGEGGRLPGRLEDLRGPWQGIVVLPVHLAWHGHREFDVAVQKSRLQLSRAGRPTWSGSSTRSG